MAKEISRIAVGVEYDGTAYKGFQKQKSTNETIQGFIDVALSQIADQKINTTCSGRTDTGVHAYCQIIHFDTAAFRAKKGMDSRWKRFIAKRHKIHLGTESQQQFSFQIFSHF